MSRISMALARKLTQSVRREHDIVLVFENTSFTCFPLTKVPFVLLSTSLNRFPSRTILACSLYGVSARPWETAYRTFVSCPCIMAGPLNS